MIKQYVLKSVALLTCALFISLYSYSALAMPEWMCVASTVEANRDYQDQLALKRIYRYEYVNAHKMRLRARVVYIENGKHHQKGDIYPGYTKYYFNSHAYDAFEYHFSGNSDGSNGVCLKTYELIKQFKKKFGNNTDNYYLKDVRIDIKGEKDCHPSGEDSSQPWMTAPTRGIAIFELYTKDGFFGSSTPCRIPTGWDTSNLDPITINKFLFPSSHYR